LKEEIQKIFKGEIEDSADIISKYSHDASIFEIAPKLVLFPKDKEDVKSLVKWVGENKSKYPDLSITSRCAGTCMAGGAIGESLILDFTKHMNRLINFNPETMSITVEPGMFYRDFEKITLEKELILPCYTASKSLNAMGGMYGNNSAGEKTLKYGKTEDYIIESKVVLADGNEYVVKNLNGEDLAQKISGATFESGVYKAMHSLISDNQEEINNAKPKVSKNSAGYYLWNVVKENNFDLNKILVGSQGTLGIATEITFRLVPNPKYSKLVAVFMNDLSPLGKLVDEILPLLPETIEAYDDKTMQLAVRFFPDFLKNKGLIGMIKFMWSFLPESVLMLSSGFPKLILLVEFSGTGNEEVHNKCVEFVEKIKPFNLKTHITKSQTESSKYWDIRRESFNLLRKHVAKKRTAPFIEDIIVRPEFLPKFIPELNVILNKYKLTYTIAGHAGDGNFHIIPLMDFRDSSVASVIMELSEEVYDLVVKYGGSITAEHNDGLVRTPYLPKMYSPKMISLFASVKGIFDPQNIFNPGKKVPILNGPGTKEYLSSHIAKEHEAKHQS